MYNFIRSLNESKKRELKQIDLPYPKDGLGRSLSKANIDIHYGKLYKGYVDRYNASKGDPDFNEAGSFLHAIFFANLNPPKGSNKPAGISLELIESKFKSWEKFKEEFLKVAMSIQGSGWVYLSKAGDIKTIKNHEIKNDIAMLIDWWEHAWYLDYGSDKEKYLNNMWKIINWSIVNDRLQGKLPNE